MTILWPRSIDVIMTILDGWTPITAKDLDIYGETIERLEAILGAGAVDLAATKFGPSGANTDLAERLDRFLQKDGALHDVAYVTGSVALGAFSDDEGGVLGAGHLIPFGKAITGANTSGGSYHVMFTAKSPGVVEDTGDYNLNVPALWWTSSKFPESCTIVATRADGSSISIASEETIEYALLAIGYGAFATGVLP